MFFVGDLAKSSLEGEEALSLPLPFLDVVLASASRPVISTALGISDEPVEEPFATMSACFGASSVPCWLESRRRVLGVALTDDDAFIGLV